MPFSATACCWSLVRTRSVGRWRVCVKDFRPARGPGARPIRTSPRCRTGARAGYHDLYVHDLLFLELTPSLDPLCRSVETKQAGIPYLGHLQEAFQIFSAGVLNLPQRGFKASPGSLYVLNLPCTNSAYSHNEFPVRSPSMAFLDRFCIVATYLCAPFAHIT